MYINIYHISPPIYIYIYIYRERERDNYKAKSFKFEPKTYLLTYLLTEWFIELHFAA